MNILLIGSNGGLGSKLANQLCLESYVDVVHTPTSKQLDVSNMKSCQDYFGEWPADVVINFAGKNYDKFVHKLSLYDNSDIENTLAVNVQGVINVAAACLPGMRQKGFGRIIYASSVLSTYDVMGTAIYSASKAFTDRFVKIAALENASKGVTVNSIQLGYMDGGLTYKLSDPESVKSTLPGKRFGTIDEIVSVIKTIISNGYINGANIALTGGL